MKEFNIYQEKNLKTVIEAKTSEEAKSKYFDLLEGLTIEEITWVRKL